MGINNLNQLFGLVLVGGKSSRMNQDKALIQYYEKPQFVYSYELIKPYCTKVFLSVREDQKLNSEFVQYPMILDQSPYLDKGPMGGILSAMQTYPQADWLVLACDLPFVTTTTIQQLINHRNNEKLATAFQSSYDQLPEPLCAIYEHKTYSPMKIFFDSGKNCPRKFLINHDVELIQQIDKMSLNNINNPEEYTQALKILKKEHTCGG